MLTWILFPLVYLSVAGEIFKLVFLLPFSPLSFHFIFVLLFFLFSPFFPFFSSFLSLFLSFEFFFPFSHSFLINFKFFSLSWGGEKVKLYSLDTELDPDPDSLFHERDPWIRIQIQIRIKMKWIHNTNQSILNCSKTVFWIFGFTYLSLSLMQWCIKFKGEN